MRADEKQRASRSIVIVAALVLGSVLTLATAGTATGSKSVTGTEAVTFTKAWTNDDGRVDGPDVGDIGDTSLIFDMWGRRSSDDPPTAGFAIDRLDKDVARCKAWIPKRTPNKTKVRIQNAYPGYVCTVWARLTNLGTFAVDVGMPLVSADPGLTFAEVGTSPLPRTLFPGRSVKVAFSIRVEQSAEQSHRRHFAIAVGLTRSDTRTCRALSPAEVPEGATRIAKKHRCVDFIEKERDARCGPGWTEATPYAWHFVASDISSIGKIRLTAVFAAGGAADPVEATVKSQENQHFWVYTESPDVLRGAYIDRTGGGLRLANTCNAPADPSN